MASKQDLTCTLILWQVGLSAPHLNSQVLGLMPQSRPQPAQETTGERIA